MNDHQSFVLPLQNTSETLPWSYPVSVSALSSWPKYPLDDCMFRNPVPPTPYLCGVTPSALATMLHHCLSVLLALSVILSPNTTICRSGLSALYVILPGSVIYEATASSLSTAFTPGGPCGPVRPRGPGMTASIRSMICSLMPPLPSWGCGAGSSDRCNT